MKAPRFSAFEWVTLAIVILLLAVVFLTGCAVPVRNENNDKPLLTAPTGTAVVKADGTTVYNPTLPQPQAWNYQHEESFDWMQLIQLALAAAGLGIGGHAFSQRGRLRRAEAGEDEGWDKLARLVPQNKDA